MTEQLICPFCGAEFNLEDATIIYISGREYHACPYCGNIPLTASLEPIEGEEYYVEEEYDASED